MTPVHYQIFFDPYDFDLLRTHPLETWVEIFTVTDQVHLSLTSGTRTPSRRDFS